MFSEIRLLLLALVATLALAGGATGAWAQRSLSVSPGGPVTLTTRSLSFGGTEGASISGDMTLVGSLHRLDAKTRGALVGLITSMTLANCRAGGALSCSVRALGLPWHLTYEAFRGTLPNITGLTIIFDMALLQEVPGVFRNCLYSGRSFFETNGAPRVTRLRIDARAVPLAARLSIGECGMSLDLRAEFTLTPAQTLRLV